MAVFSPSRLQIARERRALLAKELAAICGVTPQTISAWEAGRLQPSDEHIAGIAEETGFPQAFFFREDLDHLPEGAVSFRARTRLAARQRRSALSAAVMAQELAAWIEQRFELPPVRLPDLRGQEPELCSRVVRNEWMLGEKPIPNMIHLLESRGVLVLSLAEDVRELDAFSFWSGDRPIVLLNTMKSAERSRMDAAHELMHLVSHAEATNRRDEEAADKFAGAFLMPEQDVFRHLPRVSGLGRLMVEKHRWGVSLAGLTYRLHELGIATDWQYRMLFVELSKRGYRTKEANPMPQRESSRLLTQVFEMLEQQGLSPTSVARDLSWHRSHLDELIFGLGATLLSVNGGRQSQKSPGTRKDHLQLVKRGGPSET